MRNKSILAFFFAFAALPAILPAQGRITTPLQEFGHNIGDDYFLANYAQLTKYWEKLDQESDRMKVVRIGTSAEGRPMWMAIITSPENPAKLGRYQKIAARLAHADGLTDAQAHALAREGKAVVWIDGGLHASEVLGAQQLVEWVYEMVSRSDPETQRFLRDVILLAVPANPDGMDIVSNWYMRELVATKRSTSSLPVLYHKYIGHDNNRDSYMASQPETTEVREQELGWLRKEFGMFLEPEKMRSSSTPVKPQRLMKDLQDSLPEDALLFVDTGSCLLWAGH